MSKLQNRRKALGGFAGVLATILVTCFPMCCVAKQVYSNDHIDSLEWNQRGEITSLGLKEGGLDLFFKGATLLSEFEHLESVGILGAATGEQMSDLANCESLKNLHLRESYSSITGMNQISSLTIASANLTLENLLEISSLESLANLTFSECTFAEPFTLSDVYGMEILCEIRFVGMKLTPENLKGVGKNLLLSFDDCQISPQAFENFVGLRALSFVRTKVNDSQMKTIIAENPELNALICCQDSVSDDGFKDIGSLEDLKFLQLNSTDITDSTLIKLYGLKNLGYFEAIGSGASEAEYTRLLLHIRKQEEQEGQEEAGEPKE